MFIQSYSKMCAHSGYPKHKDNGNDTWKQF